jgi:hypothetical protein
LIRFGQQSKRAAESLGEFLERFIAKIAAASPTVSSQEVAR